MLYKIVGGGHRDKDAVTDATALHERYITITPLHFDMTDHSRKGELTEKIKNFEL